MTQANGANAGVIPAVAMAPVRFEHLPEPLGIGVDRPRLSWMISAASNNWQQAAYELEAYAADQHLRGQQTSRVESGESVLVPWPFAPLRSRQRLAVRVRVWGQDGQASGWSEPAWVEAGLLQPADWTASFITPDWQEDIARANPCPLLRHEFDARAGVRQARLYITALGVYEAQLNGVLAGDQVLAPGWTSYSHRLRYQTLDVTESVRAGRNAIGVILGDGWYRGRLGYGGGRRNIYGNRLALLAQLEIEYEDGTSERVVTDETWRAATGPILASDIYDGETFDARRERPGWSSPGYDDHDWFGIQRLDRDLATLVAPAGPPVRRTQVIQPFAITRSPSGRTLVDFGQNLVGRLRFTVTGPAGQTVTWRHAEVLENGELGTRPLRLARATDAYTLRGGAAETWEPRFTFHGFRYAEVVGWPGELKLTDVEAIVLHSDLERTGWFECSDALVNQLHENVVWSMRGNFLDVPTDCPQRDERLGWTGDIQVFSPTASFLYDVAGFLSSWMRDLAAEQTAAKGLVPFFVPNIMPRPNSPAAAWGDAAVFVPWVLYQRYGDVGLLAVQFESMRSWVDLLADLTGEPRLWETGFQFGDWLDPSASPHNPGDARTSPQIVATAYFARSAELVGRAAEALGREAEAARYLALAAQIREAFGHEYVTPNGRLMSDATTAYALALEFSLLSDANQRQQAGRRLAKLVRGSGYHISTGFVGTPLVCDALCSAGEIDAAYRLLTQRECPSWLYPVTMGATTIWERWDSMLPDGSINPGEMTSFNHYALGAVADWLHRVVGGLAPAAPGYRQLSFQPRPGGGLTSARVRHRTPYGMAGCSWRIDSGIINVEIEVPANASATVCLPGQSTEAFQVGSGNYHWSYPYTDNKASHRALSVDSPLDELIDDASAYTQVMAVFAQHNPEFAGRLNGQNGLTVRQAAELNPRADELLAQLEAILRTHDAHR
jgi:alpha-L-rhamnosidase